MSTPPNGIRPWRECPFTPGAWYRVRQSFTVLRDAFTAGELLQFDSDAWSRYDGMTGYFFRQPGRAALRVWDIGDDENIDLWKKLFDDITSQSSPSNI